MKALIAFALLAAVLFVARADLPVHCEWSQVQGKWDFRLSSDGRTSDTVYNECTYTNPLPNNVKNITVTLEAPNVARDDQGNVGTFTLIYDQGFEATLGGKRFFAFWYFTKNGDQATSHCGLTFTGWFHEDSINPQNWGCFRGYHSNPQTFVHPIKAEIKADAEFRNDLNFINKINSAQKTWTAAPYPEFEGVRMHRLLARGGRRSESFRKEAHNKHMATMKPFAQMLSKNLKVQDLPDSFDWRDKQMVSPVRNQASCGSCYTFSAAGMFESRARVQSSGVLTPVFSTQDIVNCDPYDQGCEGGFTYSVSKYGRDFGIANETCEPYVGRDGKCRHTCPTGRIYVSDYKYVGGFYGATTEEGMQEAILQRGPISVDFYVYRDFFYYQSGVYVHNKDLAAPEPHFEETNHAVLAVGWGVSQDGTKYWIVKNSWGAGWGMNGYFLIRRGTDECGIESSAVEAILKL